jgi:hypothetical protein
MAVESARHAGASRSRLVGARTALGLLALLAVALRAQHLGSPTLRVDEAESAINALTIVADGVPGDHFLGQPLYENTLVRPWPESPEYEFRDISYSEKGLAVYHGWLPLYAIAAGFRLAGVTPERARHGTPPRDASPAEARHWTAVPRWPSVVASAVLVVAAFGLGRAVQGANVGWALAIATAFSNVFVWFGRQARYYSATLAATTACGLAIWNACRRGRTSDHVLAGVAVGVLFHVHSLSAVTMAAVYVASLPLARRQPRLWLRILAAGVAGGALVLPWAVWSGWLGRTADVPAARHYLDLPILLASIPTTDPAILATATLGLAWLAVARLRGPRLGERWRRPIVEAGAGFYFATTWLVLSYLLFTALIPAASYFVERLKLVVVMPGLLLNALVIAAVSRALAPASRLLPVAGLIAMLVLAGQLPPKKMLDRPDRDLEALAGGIRSWSLGPEGRILATPNQHLVLTYYSGQPVQSIFPVRRRWLDDFTGDLVVIEGPSYWGIPTDGAREAARSLGRDLTPAQLEARAGAAARLATVLDLAADGARVRSPALDDLDLALVGVVRDETRKAMRRVVDGTALARAAAPSNWKEFRQAFFYWFARPDRRVGTGLNYAACRDSAAVHVDSSGFAVFDCRRVREPPLFPAAVSAVRVDPP